MNQDKTIQFVNTKAIIIGMALLFIALQIGFHPTYLQHFPGFEKFNWLHHTHGAIMVSWMFILVIQPYLIHKRKYAVHRLIGKISYVIAPLMLISMFLVTRLNYLTTVGKIDFKDVAYIQALNFIEPLSFFTFYVLAVINKNDVSKHKRYMIATSFPMIMAIFSRILHNRFGTTIEPYEYFIPLYFCSLISILLLVNDILRKNNPIPSIIITAVILLNTLIFHARYTEVWQAIVRLVGDTIF
ncbi:MAG: hypothetical protein IPL27_21565 [Lewinellaceae bacterium]|nr:hypothetical protein [Lewinellaceae bacterium]